MRNMGMPSGKKGFTLIEVVISIAVLAIVILALSNMLLYSYNLLHRSSGQKIKNMNTAAGIEQTTADNSDGYPNTTIVKTPGSFQIQFGSTTAKISGNYIKSTDADKDSSYSSFIPN